MSLLISTKMSPYFPRAQWYCIETNEIASDEKQLSLESITVNYQHPEEIIFDGIGYERRACRQTMAG